MHVLIAVLLPAHWERMTEALAMQVSHELIRVHTAGRWDGLTMHYHPLPYCHPFKFHLQVSCQADLTVFKYNQFWGQGDERLGDVSAYDCVRPPLGQLEYLLDPQARTQQAEKAKDDAPQQQQQ